jgi:hypothetical protein
MSTLVDRVLGSDPTASSFVLPADVLVGVTVYMVGRA